MTGCTRGIKPVVTQERLAQSPRAPGDGMWNNGQYAPAIPPSRLGMRLELEQVDLRSVAQDSESRSGDWDVSASFLTSCRDNVSNTLG